MGGCVKGCAWLSASGPSAAPLRGKLRVEFFQWAWKNSIFLGGFLVVGEVKGGIIAMAQKAKTQLRKQGV